MSYQVQMVCIQVQQLMYGVQMSFFCWNWRWNQNYQTAGCLCHHRLLLHLCATCQRLSATRPWILQTPRKLWRWGMCGCFSSSLSSPQTRNLTVRCVSCGAFKKEKQQKSQRFGVRWLPLFQYKLIWSSPSFHVCCAEDRALGRIGHLFVFPSLCILAT